MTRAQTFVKAILGDRQIKHTNKTGKAFAPSNIALCKYWGKRDRELNLPVQSSLSIGLRSKGTTTSIGINDCGLDRVYLDGELLDGGSQFAQRLVRFLDFFRDGSRITTLEGSNNEQHHDSDHLVRDDSTGDGLENSGSEQLHDSDHRVRYDSVMYFDIHTSSNIPTGAGLASSASGFAALVLALDDLFEWGLSKKELSLLARLGSGSAARSLWNGFVEWHHGIKQEKNTPTENKKNTAAQDKTITAPIKNDYAKSNEKNKSIDRKDLEDGMDSFAEPIDVTWPELCIGLLIVDSGPKSINSTIAMNRTIETSTLYKQWPERAAKDLQVIKQAIINHDFKLLGLTAENNAIAMHDTMRDASPSIDYANDQTRELIQKTHNLRDTDLQVYFTQDAGPNLKLLFLQKDIEDIKQNFPGCEILDNLF